MEDPARSQAHQALGRSRGGLTTKVHLAVDGRGVPLSIVLTPGNVNDATAFADVLDGVRIPRASTGRPRPRRRRPRTSRRPCRGTARRGPSASAATGPCARGASAKRGRAPGVSVVTPAQRGCAGAVGGEAAKWLVRGGAATPAPRYTAQATQSNIAGKR
ncbi:transposase [Streptomonospora mangrovi]|uniref:transposase n=1 Tax=Streptomonospora mangrovi TaxID=2883123 RepID=UPI0038CD4B53